MSKETTMNAFEMKAALIQANKSGNRHAINKKDCEKAGVDRVALEMWETGVENLRSTIAPYVVEKMKKDADPKELTKLRNRIFPQWKKLIKKGEANLVTDLNADVDSLVGFAETWINTPKGSVWAVDTPLIFRKSVEAFIGCKIAQNAVLTDNYRDAIRAYTGAKKKIANINELLNGKDLKSGEHVMGILNKIAVEEHEIKAAQNRILEIAGFANKAKDEAKEFFMKMEEGLKNDLKKHEAALTKLKNQKEQSEKELKEAQKALEDNEATYLEAMNTIHEIGEC